MSYQTLHPRTAIINQKQKNSSKLARLNALSWLAKKFPEAFDNEKKIRPLKIGIIDDILEYCDEANAEGISKSKLREAVVVFTRRVDYLTCLKARETRVDLIGQPTTEVTEEEAERAALKIRKRVEKSAKNARKAMAGKTPNYYQSSDRNSGHANHEYDPQSEDREGQLFPQQKGMPERLPAYSSHRTQSPAPKNASAVVIRHKKTGRVSPDTVARLKEKLGLNKEASESENS